jgi:plasmid stabilization system protein ParE
LTIVWAPEAADDLDAAVGYLAERNPEAASKLAESVVALVEWLASTPIDGPAHRLRTGEIVRGWPHPPLRIYYQRAKDTLRIVRVYHQRREPITR